MMPFFAHDPLHSAVLWPHALLGFMTEYAVQCQKQAWKDGWIEVLKLSCWLNNPQHSTYQELPKWMTQLMGPCQVSGWLMVSFDWGRWPVRMAKAKGRECTTCCSEFPGIERNPWDVLILCDWSAETAVALPDSFVCCHQGDLFILSNHSRTTGCPMTLLENMVTSFSASSLLWELISKLSVVSVSLSLSCNYLITTPLCEST